MGFVTEWLTEIQRGELDIVLTRCENGECDEMFCDAFGHVADHAARAPFTAREDENKAICASILEEDAGAYGRFLQWEEVPTLDPKVNEASNEMLRAFDDAWYAAPEWSAERQALVDYERSREDRMKNLPPFSSALIKFYESEREAIPRLLKEARDRKRAEAEADALAAVR